MFWVGRLWKQSQKWINIKNRRLNLHLKMTSPNVTRLLMGILWKKNALLFSNIPQTIVGLKKNSNTNDVIIDKTTNNFIIFMGVLLFSWNFPGIPFCMSFYILYPYKYSNSACVNGILLCLDYFMMPIYSTIKSHQPCK